MHDTPCSILYIVLVLLFLPILWQGSSLSAQDRTINAGIEFQAYPTGLIPGLALDLPTTDRSSIHIRLGYNYVRHRDLGEHDDERGDGIGFSLGWKTKPFSRWELLCLELRSDIWFNKLEWRDDLPSGPITGMSKITVFQPTLVAGYEFFLNENVSLFPTLAFGFEVNVVTDGEEVGQGAILLIGFQLFKKLK